VLNCLESGIEWNPVAGVRANTSIGGVQLLKNRCPVCVPSKLLRSWRGAAFEKRRTLLSDCFFEVCGLWFPFDTKAARADALVHAPAAFRRRGVFVAPQELEVA